MDTHKNNNSLYIWIARRFQAHLIAYTNFAETYIYVIWTSYHES